ncbi:MAG: UDP-phosphate galactose phosphotransferase [Candidatus Marinimicrobia bacterium]|nr:UDP-phosphate galactose phosphotransferase [Candidatus Neomarinimicrobiota bacterium]
MYISIKFFFDFFFALFLIIFLSPVFVVVILILFLSRDSDIFFIHQRIGKNGKEFNLYKFRTMKHSRSKILSEYFEKFPSKKKYWDENQKLKNDPRVTKIGYLLREFSLDELPQILNVLKGEMSFVGPRPIVESEKQKYGERFSSYKKVKPGLSGLWQVSGRNDTTYDKRVELDYLYTQNISFALDLKIFFKTIYVIMNRKGAY